MCVIKKIVCVLVKFEWDFFFYCKITNPITLCTSGLLLASNGENVVLRANKILLKANFLRYQSQI